MCHVSGIQWKKSVLRVKIEESMIRGGIERDVLLSRKLKYTSASYLSVYLKGVRVNI